MSSDGREIGPIKVILPVGAFDECLEKETTTEVDAPAAEGTELTDEELREAAADAGLAILDKRKIRGFSKIGKHLRKVGLIDVARGKMWGRLDALERGRAVMLQLVEDRVTFMATDDKPVVHHEVVLAAANALAIIVRAENETDKTCMDLEKGLLQDAKPTGSRSFPPPGSPVIPIQAQTVNINATQSGQPSAPGPSSDQPAPPK